MNSKNKSPVEVTLKKASSGTWEVPGPPKRTFSPWQRLWFVTGAIYLLLLAGSYHMLVPNQESIERRMVFSITEEVRRYDGMAFAGESPAKIFENAQSQGYAAWIAATRARFRIGPEGNSGFDKIEANYRDAITDLPAKRVVGILICIVFWVVPMAIFYAIGYVIDWIKRGVTNPTGNSR